MTRKLTPDQLDEIEAAAKRALSGDGPWTFQRWGGQNQNGDYAESILFDSRGESLTYGLPNLEGDHIAMMDPATTLALVARLREAEQMVRLLRDVYQAKCDRIVAFAGLAPDDLDDSMDMEAVEEMVAARIEKAEAKVERATTIARRFDKRDPMWRDMHYAAKVMRALEEEG